MNPEIKKITLRDLMEAKGQMKLVARGLGDKERTKEEILASLQYHLSEAQRLTELIQDTIIDKLNGKEGKSS